MADVLCSRSLNVLAEKKRGQGLVADPCRKLATTSWSVSPCLPQAVAVSEHSCIIPAEEPIQHQQVAKGQYRHEEPFIKHLRTHIARTDQNNKEWNVILQAEQE